MQETKQHTISRRRLLLVGLPALGALCLPGIFSCNDKTTETKQQSNTKTRTKNYLNKKQEAQKRDYTNDQIFLHSKTMALHYPALFKNYQKLPEKFITAHPVTDWEKLLAEGAHFTKDRSAPIFEALALRELKNGASETAIAKAVEVMARTFSAEYASQNRFNWRGHDLLSQLVAMDNSKTADAKFAWYQEQIKATELSTIKKVPKRNAWLSSQPGFDERVRQILSKREELQQKLISRIT